MTDTTNPVRTAIQPHQNTLKHITINHDAIDQFAHDHADDTFDLPNWDAPVFPDVGDWPIQRTINYFIIGNALNFCFNDMTTANKFEAERMGMTMDGAFGMWLCLYHETTNSTHDMTDPDTLKHIDRDDIDRIFAPSNNTPLPLPDERVTFLNDIGRFLKTTNITEATDNTLFSDNGFVTTLVRETDAYGHDTRTLNNTTIPFNKRAQLAAMMLHGYYQNTPHFTKPDINALTIPADYGVPNTLRGLDILTYDNHLARRIDTQTPIDADTRAETELRIATVLAGEHLHDALNNKRDTPITIPELDYRLWSLRRESPYNEHLTKTTAY